MENVNLSELIGDNCANSFALAFRSMFCTEFIPEKNQAERLISRYLKEYEQEILIYFDKNVLEDYCFVTDTLLKKREMIDDEITKIVKCSKKVDYYEIEQLFEIERSLEFTQLFNSGPYNLGMILSLIDESTEIDIELVKANSSGKYFKGDLLLVNKMDRLTSIHLGISSFIIEFNQMSRQFNWNKHYNVAPNMQYLIKNQRRYQCYKDSFVQNDPGLLAKGDGFLSDILLLIDLYRIKQQCTLEKFMISLLFIAMSPEYEEWMQQYAYTIINILNEIMFCGEVHRLYLQEGYYNIWVDSEKTSKDATTRMSIIFSANNDDIYILRVDLPHKGEKLFHINLEEVVGETILPTGYPMTHEEFNKWKPDCDEKILNHLFFELNNQIWFRTRFETRLKHENISAELRDKFKELFHQQAHIAITTKILGDNKCENQIAFVDEVRNYLKRLSIPESYYLSFGKDDIAYSKEIKKVRGLFQVEKYIMKLICDKNDCRVKANEILSLFKRYMDIEIDLGELSEASSLFEVWEMISIIV
ncbi:MAG: hypothetical protein K2K63_11185 [Acetatifactor sp.]|nr:hypothetical protein [Acetatifactor sp.]